MADRRIRIEPPECVVGFAGHAAGTAEIERVEIVRNGDVWQTPTGDGSPTCRFEVEDVSSLDEATYYYARVIQRDDEHAWSSPIWLDPPAR